MIPFRTLTTPTELSKQTKAITTVPITTVDTLVTITMATATKILLNTLQRTEMPIQVITMAVTLTGLTRIAKAKLTEISTTLLIRHQVMGINPMVTLTPQVHMVGNKTVKRVGKSARIKSRRATHHLLRMCNTRAHKPKMASIKPKREATITRTPTLRSFAPTWLKPCFH